MSKKNSSDFASSKKPPAREDTEFSVASSRASTREARPVPPAASRQVQGTQEKEGDEKPPLPVSSLKKVTNPTSTDDKEGITAVSNYYLQSAGCIDKKKNESHDRAMEKEDLKIKQAAAAPPIGGQNENEGDKKPPAIFSSLKEVANPTSSRSPRVPDEGITKKDTPRGLAMASGTPAYQPRRAAATAHDEDHNVDDSETNFGGVEPPTLAIQAHFRVPGAFREGGRPQDDDEETLYTTATPSAPQQRLPADIVAQAELVEERTVAPPPPPDDNLVIPLAEPAPEKWWSKRRNVYILVAVVIVITLGAVAAFLFAGRDDPPSPATLAPTLPPTPAPTPPPTPDPVIVTLEVIYNATGGDNWDSCSRGDRNPCFIGGRSGTPWLTKNDPCGWGGVRCNGNAQVTELDLEFNGLVGSLPSEVASLSALEVLDLAFNELTGTIPESLANLFNLKELYLSSNELTGTIPESLANLFNLVFLRFENNMLTGSIPAAICNDPTVASITADADICAASVSPCCRLP